jgi:hypothetical protein
LHPTASFDAFHKNCCRNSTPVTSWMSLLFIITATLFYAPRYLWKIWESNRIRSLTCDLNNPLLDDVKRKRQIGILIQYFKCNFNCQNFYAYRFFICEFLNLFNVILQIYFVDKFLGNEFTTYGRDVMRFSEIDQELRVDPMIKIFPKVTKCIFRMYGPTGSIQIIDGEINLIN